MVSVQFGQMEPHGTVKHVEYWTKPLQIQVWGLVLPSCGESCPDAER